MKYIIISAGGTGGHIIPAVAVAKELKKNGINPIFIGNKNSLEQELASKNEIPFFEVNVQKLYRKFTWKHFRFPFRLVSSFIKAKKIISKFQPDAFLGTGSFVSGPIGIAAYFSKIPIFIQEQNSFPGLTNRWLGKAARKIFLGNTVVMDVFEEKKCSLTGNPTFIKNKHLKLSNELYEKYNLDKNKKTLLLFGGSQGAEALNKIIEESHEKILELGFNIIWQTGRRNLGSYIDKYSQKGMYLFDFSDNMQEIYNLSDIAVARGGALSLAELDIMKIPAIIVPYPYATGNHQYYNALDLLNSEKIKIIRQEDLEKNKLLDEIVFIKDNYSYFRKNFKESIHKNAAGNIAKQIKNEIEA